MDSRRIAVFCRVSEFAVEVDNIFFEVDEDSEREGRLTALKGGEYLLGFVSRFAAGLRWSRDVKVRWLEADHAGGKGGNGVIPNFQAELCWQLGEGVEDCGGVGVYLSQEIRRKW